MGWVSHNSLPYIMTEGKFPFSQIVVAKTFYSSKSPLNNSRVIPPCLLLASIFIGCVISPTGKMTFRSDWKF